MKRRLLDLLKGFLMGFDCTIPGFSIGTLAILLNVYERLINDLSKNYHLPNPVINAVVDYVLTKADNVLSRAYAEKVAASLVRENARTAVDAMNYLRKIDKKTRGKKVTKKMVLPAESIKPNKENPTDKSKTSDDADWELEWDRLMDELNGGDDGGKA